jgi:hypothetical protein
MTFEDQKVNVSYGIFEYLELFFMFLRDCFNVKLDYLFCPTMDYMAPHFHSFGCDRDKIVFFPSAP